MYESPTYDVIETFPNFSIRKYHDFYTIKTNEKSLLGYQGFQYLFSYISGDNQKQTKMKMTVPVINDFQSQTMTMEFVIPKIHVNDIPKPNDPNLTIKHYPEQLFLVHSFTGGISQTKVSQLIEKIRTQLQSTRYRIHGEAKVARYNSPFSLPFLRHNEVWLPIKVFDNSDTIHTR